MISFGNRRRRRFIIMIVGSSIPKPTGMQFIQHTSIVHNQLLHFFCWL